MVVLSYAFKTLIVLCAILEYIVIIRKLDTPRLNKTKLDLFISIVRIVGFISITSFVLTGVQEEFCSPSPNYENGYYEGESHAYSVLDDVGFDWEDIDKVMSFISDNADEDTINSMQNIYDYFDQQSVSIECIEYELENMEEKWKT